MRARRLLLAAALAMTACGGDAETVEEAPAAAPAPEETADAMPDEEMEAGYLVHLESTQLETVDACGEGDTEACITALDFLTAQDRAEIQAFCDAGDELACSTHLNLLDAEVGPDCAADEPGCGAPDEPTAGGFIQLNAAGVDTDEGLLEFGADAEEAYQRLVAYWGPPSNDTGWIDSAGNCNVGDSFRSVEWGEFSDTTVTFIEGAPAHGGAAHLAAWMTSDSNQSTIAFVGDATEVPILSGHTTVGEMQAQLGDAIEVGDFEPLGPSFYIEDNFGSLSGELTGTSEEDIVQSINAGSGCAE